MLHYVTAAAGNRHVPPYGRLLLSSSSLQLTGLSVLAKTSGSATYAYGVPNSPSLAGLTTYHQVRIVDDLRASASWRFTNAVVDQIAR